MMKRLAGWDVRLVVFSLSSGFTTTTGSESGNGQEKKSELWITLYNDVKSSIFMIQTGSRQSSFALTEPVSEAPYVDDNFPKDFRAIKCLFYASTMSCQKNNPPNTYSIPRTIYLSNRKKSIIQTYVTYTLYLYSRTQNAHKHSYMYYKCVLQETRDTWHK